MLAGLARIPAWTLRHEGRLWLGLAVATVLAAVFALPRLELRFSLRELFEKGHPAREAYDRFQEAFDAGPRALVYFEGPGLFSTATLAEMVELGYRIRRLKGTREVLSAADLVEPVTTAERLRLVRILRPEVTADPAAVRARLLAPDMAGLWEGLLYDRELRTLALVITPPAADQDPFAMRAWLAALRAEAEATATRTGTSFHLGGDFFVHQEVRRAAIENQIYLTKIAGVIQVAIVWSLFGSLRVALGMFFVLGISIYFGFVGLALLGIPLNVMSASFAVMVMTIGTSDAVHMLGRYALARQRYGKRGAALRAVCRGAFPVFLNTVTTVGCVLVGSLTPLAVVRQFSLSLAVGCVVAYVLTVLLAPALFVRSGIEGTRGLYFRLHDWLQAQLSGVLLGIMQSRFTLPATALLTVVSIWGAAGLRIDSNWYRYFPPGRPVAKTLAFVARVGLPVSLLDLTWETGATLEDLLADPAYARDVAKVVAILESRPGIMGADSIFRVKDFVEGRVARLALPPGIGAEWAEPRRDAMRMQYRAAGLYRSWYAPGTRSIRLVAAGTLETSRQFLELEAALRERLAGERFEKLDPGKLALAGQTIYWSAIMDAIPRSFLSSMAGSVAVVTFCFWLICGSLSLSLLALIPNVVPLFAMFAAANLAGITLNETVCLITALAEGIAVDDTIHFLYHFAKARRRGDDALAAVRETFMESGASIVVTACLFTTGFAVCLLADVYPLQQMGFCLVVSVLVAAAAELVMVPALLLRGSGPAHRGREDLVDPGAGPGRALQEGDRPDPPGEVGPLGRAHQGDAGGPQA